MTHAPSATLDDARPGDGARRWCRAAAGALAWVIVAVALGGCASGGRGQWPLVADVHPHDETTRPGDAGEITVASYNVGHQRGDRDALRAQMRQVDAHVWLLQEVRLPSNATSRDVGDVVAALRRLLPGDGWHVAVARVNPVHAKRGSDHEAQVIASQLPIARAEVWPLASRSDRRRAAVAAWLDAGGVELLVVNTDHEPGYLARGVVTHQAHARDLAGHLARHPDTPAVVGGDFNTTGNLWRLRSGRRDALLAAAAMQPAGFAPALRVPAVTFARLFVRARLDHLFVRDVELVAGGVAAAAAGASDHRPVWCRVRLPDRPATTDVAEASR